MQEKEENLVKKRRRNQRMLWTMVVRRERKSGGLGEKRSWMPSHSRGGPLEGCLICDTCLCVRSNFIILKKQLENNITYICCSYSLHVLRWYHPLHTITTEYPTSPTKSCPATIKSLSLYIFFSHCQVFSSSPSTLISKFSMCLLHPRIFIVALIFFVLLIHDSIASLIV